MASNARQSVFGGFFGSSLNLVILPFFMRLRSSGGYDSNFVASSRVSDEEHPTLDHADRVETQLAGRVDVIELDHIGVEEHFRGRPEVDAMLLAVGLLLRAVPLEVHRKPRAPIYWYSVPPARSAACTPLHAVLRAGVFLLGRQEPRRRSA